MLSSNTIKKLGKRLRDGVHTSTDLDLLDAYRAEFEPLLLETCARIVQSLDGELQYIVAGRTKRTKSIIRKLARDPNSGMDLSRMSDIVGLRVIVADVASQDLAVSKLHSNINFVREPYDYRGRSSGYRAVHLIAGDTVHRVEIQVRTLPQHLWADESERLGEQVKEGSMDAVAAEHLSRLQAFSRAIDYGVPIGNEADLVKPEWSFSLARQVALFQDVTRQQLQRQNQSYVVVYHQLTNTLLRVESFRADERLEALSFFKNVSRGYDGAEYDVLVLNSPSQNALVVTHPRYFPEGFSLPPN
jgi:ppGpp synthetase/RelA/SpoT-type nucleotidyltranferase